MVNGGDFGLLNNVFPGFHISGVCSDIVALTEFCTDFECFSQDLTDFIDSAANSTTFFTVSPSAVYNGVVWSRAARG